MPRTSALPPGVPPRLLNREAAAEYVGFSPTKFDELVRRGVFPKPVRIDRRVAWDVVKIDRAVDALADTRDDETNPFD